MVWHHAQMTAFEVVRAATIAADPARVHALVNDFHEWPQWSPWEDIDPAMERSYTGAERGVGAHYAWSGNRKAGEGTMEITSSSPEEICVALEFRKPFKADNQVTFTILQQDGGTVATWRMSGNTIGVAAVFAKVVPMDKLLGKDFERGLARLRAAAEA